MWRTKERERRETCFSAILEKVEDSSNKKNEIIPNLFARHFAKNFVSKEIGDEADLSMRAEYNRAIDLEERGYFVAIALLRIKDEGARFGGMELGEFIELIRTYSVFLDNTDVLLQAVNLPEQGHAKWAKDNIQNIESLLEKGKFTEIGFSQGMLKFYGESKAGL